MKENLTALAKARLYEPNPRAPDIGEFDPTSQSPTGLIRQAMRVAGGVSPSDNAAQISTNGEGSAWITTPDGSSPGGIATGELIAGIIRDEGGAIQGYRWVYGPADRRNPFHPHMALEGFIFHSFTDPRLVIGGSFPSTGHYIPGDHVGCICDVEPIVLTPEQVEQMRREGRLGQGVAPPAPPPPPPPPPPLPPQFQPPVLRKRVKRGEPAGIPPDAVSRAKLRAAVTKKALTKAKTRHTRDQTDLDRVKFLLKKAKQDGNEPAARSWARQVEARERQMPRVRDEFLAAHNAHEAALDTLDEAMDEWIGQGGVVVAPAPKAKKGVQAKAFQDWVRQAEPVDRTALLKKRQEPYPRNMTARQAQEWLEERWGGLTDRGLPRHISIGHLPDDAAEAIGRAWAEMAQEYPRTAERIQFLGASDTVDRAARPGALARGANARTFKISERAVADAWDFEPARWIRLNTNYYGTASDFASIQKRRKTWAGGNGSHHPIGTESMDGTTHHEFGHHLHYEAESAGYGVNGRIDDILQQAEDDLFGGPRYAKLSAAKKREALVSRGVSKYATAGTKKHGELVAEIVSWRHGTRWEEAPAWVKAIYRVIRDAAEGA
jgi:hypothetical protein